MPIRARKIKKGGGEKVKVDKRGKGKKIKKGVRREKKKRKGKGKKKEPIIRLNWIYSL